MDLDEAADTIPLSGRNDSTTDDVQVLRRHNNSSLDISPIHNDATSLTGSNNVCISINIRLPSHIVDCGIQHGMVEDDVVASNPQKPWQPFIVSLDRHC